MNNHLTYIEEPKLKFAHNQSAEDSRDGLTLFGPYQSVGGSSTIRAGYVGTQVGLEYYHTFVMQMNRPIYTKSLGRPFFLASNQFLGLIGHQIHLPKLFCKKKICKLRCLYPT